MFIEFANSSDCQAAQLSLTGRKFSNRVVVTRFDFSSNSLSLTLSFPQLLQPGEVSQKGVLSSGMKKQRRSVVSFSVASQHSARLKLLSFYITT